MCFIRTNVKDLESSKKQLKSIEYLEHKLESNRVSFLQNPHSVSNDRNAWNDDFKGQAFFHMVHLTLVCGFNSIVRFFCS